MSGRPSGAYVWIGSNLLDAIAAESGGHRVEDLSYFYGARPVDRYVNSVLAITIAGSVCEAGAILKADGLSVGDWSPPRDAPPFEPAGWGRND